MITLMPESRLNLLAVRASGRLSRDDYEERLIPQIEELLRQYSKLRVLFLMDESFRGWSLDAAWDNTLIDLRHRADFDRIAIVGAPTWEAWCVRLASMLIKAEFRTFPRERLRAAFAWLEESPCPTGSRPVQLQRDTTEEEELWESERRLWQERAPAFKSIADHRCVIAIGPPLEILSGLDSIAASVESAPRWDDVRMTERVLSRSDPCTCVLAYRAEGRRSGATDYSAYCTSTYRHKESRWLLIQHQQAPLGEWPG